jgi:hypothetical protein
MRIVLAVILLLGFTVPAYANLDYKCLSTCTKNGMAPAACTPQCTYTDVPSSGPSPQGLDYKCRSRCVRQGYTFGYCSAVCTQVPGGPLTPGMFGN